jgi:hypothetical protein
LKDDCKLSVVAAMNPISYSGVNTLNEDLKSRFTGRVWKHDLQSQLDNAVSWNIDTIPQPMRDIIVNDLKVKIVTLCENMRRLRISGEISYSLSVRDIKQFVDVLRMFSKGKDFDDGHGGCSSEYFDTLSRVLNTTVTNHKLDSEEERKAVSKLLQDIFGVDV